MELASLKFTAQLKKYIALMKDNLLITKYHGNIYQHVHTSLLPNRAVNGVHLHSNAWYIAHQINTLQ